MPEFSDEKFADVVWVVEDVLSIKKDWTEEQAYDFLASNEGTIRDRMIEVGWDVIHSLL